MNQVIPRITVLTADQVAQVHSWSLEILATIGVRVDSPHEDGQAQEAGKGQERPATECHLERSARGQHERLSQKTFAPRAAPHMNHSRRSNAVKTSRR